MTPEQKAAFVIAQAACANAEIAGMQAGNAAHRAAGYGYDIHTRADFLAVIDKYVIGNNAVLTLFQE